jgi:hypothetical protein
LSLAKALASIGTEPSDERFYESGSRPDTSRIRVERDKFRVLIEPSVGGKSLTTLRNQRRQTGRRDDLSVHDNRNGVSSIAQKAANPYSVRWASRSYC